MNGIVEVCCKWYLWSMEKRESGDEVGASAITTTSTSRRKFHKAGWHI